jgi:hypothetical protein
MTAMYTNYTALETFYTNGCHGFFFFSFLPLQTKIMFLFTFTPEVCKSFLGNYPRQPLCLLKYVFFKQKTCSVVSIQLISSAEDYSENLG